MVDPPGLRYSNLALKPETAETGATFEMFGNTASEAAPVRAAE